MLRALYPARTELCKALDGHAPISRVKRSKTNVISGVWAQAVCSATAITWRNEGGQTNIVCYMHIVNIY